jgi:anti-sigma B factor antagonist
LDFDLQVEQVEGWTVVTVSGDLDVLSAPRLRDRLDETVGSGAYRLLVDLTPTEFIDSSGLSALVGGLKVVRALGGDMTLVCPPGNTRRIIEIIALDQVFKLYDRREDAMISPHLSGG